MKKKKTTKFDTDQRGPTEKVDVRYAKISQLKTPPTASHPTTQHSSWLLVLEVMDFSSSTHRKHWLFSKDTLREFDVAVKGNGIIIGKWHAEAYLVCSSLRYVHRTAGLDATVVARLVVRRVASPLH